MGTNTICLEWAYKWTCDSCGEVLQWSPKDEIHPTDWLWSGHRFLCPKCSRVKSDA